LDDVGARWIDYADLDGDSDLDVIISGIISISVLINYDSLYSDETSMRIPEIPGPTGFNMPGLGDFDNDGDIDIYLTKATQIEDNYLINDGSGFFELADERIPDTQASSRWAEPFDADNDGDLDIYIGCTGDGQQHILINHSTPDTMPPVLMAEDLPSGDIDSLSQYQCRVSAYDNISVAKGALHVEIFYRIDGGEFFSDKLVHCGGTIFGGFIPGQPVGTHIEYYINIRDQMNNFITTPPDAPDSLYGFNVLPNVGIYEEPSVPGQFGMRISPNPSNGVFTVSYSAGENLQVNVYDIMGRKLHTESLPGNNADEHRSWRWPGWRKLPSGIYFVELSGLNRREVKKALLIR
jgi:hypothetical protein